MSKTLGLDLGTNSIGWALVDNEGNEIIGMGARIFPAGVENLGDGNKEQSKNSTRTENRGIRRQIYRRRLRKQYLLKLLAENKMCPIQSNIIREWNLNDLSNKPEFANWIKQDPYELRARALNEKLTLEELGRALFHMIQRRGFQSNSRNAGGDKEEGRIYEGNPKDGKVGIEQTKEEKGNLTLGAYLNTIKPAEKSPFKYTEKRIRNRYTTREMYIQEFEEIWTVQSGFHSELTDELKGILGGRKKDGYPEDGALFHQRPLRSQKYLLGKCSLEPTKNKCPKSHFQFELFNIYQWVNTVDCNNGTLTKEDRDKLARALMTKEKYTFKQLRKVIGKEDTYYQFNYNDSESIRKAYTIPQLSSKKFFSKQWFSFTEKEQEDIWHALFFFDDKRRLKQYAIDKWGFDYERADQISKFRLKDGYAHLSRKAIRNILPFLKEGYNYSDAVALAGVKNAFGNRWESFEESELDFLMTNVLEIVHSGQKGGYIEPLKRFLTTDFDLSEKALKKIYHHSTDINKKVLLDKLPVSNEADREIQGIRNPVVITALFELRKVINELIDRFGKPDQIHIELSRDLKDSKTNRNKKKLEISRLERENDRVRDEVNRLGYDTSSTNLIKYKLWEECNKTCPFTGQTIEVSQLFTPEVEIEHIHPLSRSLNDSFTNKTLCFTAENKRKGKRTPYEYYFNTFGEEKWEEVKKQALFCFRNKEHYPRAYNKFKYFVKEKHDDDFISRQLNDTRYITKVASDYLSKICGNITPMPGQMTAIIRKMWGVNRILNPEDFKEREDHRHHAVDALVVACMNRSHLQALSKYAEYDDSFRYKQDFPQPWEQFRWDTEKMVDTIFVSHRLPGNALTTRQVKVKKDGKLYINKGMAARGQLHVETIYGKRQAPGLSSAYHVRKPLNLLSTEKQINKIVDPVVRSIILEHIQGIGGFQSGGKIPDGAFFKSGEDGSLIPLLFLPNKNGDKVPIRKVRVKESIGYAAQLKDDNQYVNPRNNHHVVVYEKEDGSIDEHMVTFWTVIERKLQKQPIIQLPKDGNRIIATLRENDMFIMGLKELPDLTTQQGQKDVMERLYKVQKISPKHYDFRRHTDSRLDKDAKKDYLRIQSFGEGKTGWITHNPIKVSISYSGLMKKL